MISCIKTSTATEQFAIHAGLLALGFKWHGEDGWTPEKIQERYPWKIYPVVLVNTFKKYLGGRFNDDSHFSITTFKQVIDYIDSHLKPKGESTFRLNSLLVTFKPDSVQFDLGIGMRQEVDRATFDKLIEQYNVYHS